MFKKRKVRRKAALIFVAVFTVAAILGSNHLKGLSAQEEEMAQNTGTTEQMTTEGTESTTQVTEAEKTTTAATEKTTEVQATTQADTKVQKAATASTAETKKRTAVNKSKASKSAVIINGDFTKFLTKFEFKDQKTGESFSDTHPVTKDSSVLIRYEFKIPNNVNIEGGSTYKLKLPSVFHLENLTGTARKLNESQQGAVDEVPNWTIHSDNTITVAFPKTLTESNVEGYIQIQCSVDAEKLVDQVIIFDLGQLEGYGKEYKTDVEPEVTKKSPGVKKSGTLNRDDQTITWSVTATPDAGDKNLKGYKLTDTFKNPEEQEFVSGSMTLDGTPAADPTLTEKGWEYTFGDVSDGDHLITYKTKIPDKYFEDMKYNQNGSAQINNNITNTVKIETADQKGEASSTASVRATQYQFIKTKDSPALGYDDTEDRTWLGYKLSAIYDNGGRIVEPVLISDQLPSGTYLNEEQNTLRVNYGDKDIILKKVSGSEPGINQYTYDEKTNILKIKLDPKQTSANVYYKIWLDTEGNHGELSSNPKNNAVITIGNNIELTEWEDGFGWTPGYETKKIDLNKSGSLVNKDGKQFIDWKVTINKNPSKNVTGNVDFTDTLGDGLEYVSGSFKASYGGKDYTDPVVQGNIIKYTIKNLGKNVCTITYRTKITSDLDLKQIGDSTTHTGTKFSNQVKLFWEDKDKETSGQGAVTIKTDLKKSGAYNAKEDRYDWTVTANSYGLAFQNFVMTDKLPEHHTLVDGSLKFGNTVLTKDPNATAPYYEENNGTIVIHFSGDQIFTSASKITLSTTTDQPKEKTVTAVNTVSAAADEISGELTAKSTVTVTFTPSVEKTTSYKKGNYVEWTVDINKNHKVLTKQKAKLTDNLPAGLTYRMGSVSLVDKSNKDTVISGVEAEYDAIDGKIVFTLPDGLSLDHYYQMKFITDVTTATGEIKNTITLDASAEEVSSTTEEIPLILEGASSGLTGDNIRVIVQKNEAGTTDPLENVVFQLYDSNNNKVGDEKRTDETGRIAFDAGLKYENTYYLREVQTLDGYELPAKDFKLEIGQKVTGQSKAAIIFDGTTYSFEPDSTGTLNIKLGIDNMAKRGSVELLKVNSEDAAEVLKDAEFSLHKKDGTLIAENLKTDDQGKIKYDYLKFGDYYFMETKAPEGFKLDSGKKYAFTINDEAISTPIVITAENEAKYGSVELKKLDSEDETKTLAGAEFSLYTKDGVLLEEGLKTDENGTLKRGHLRFGDYYFQETKAPEGYHLNGDTKYEFTINDESVETPAGVSVVNVPTKVAISKQDSETKEPLADARLQILKVEANGAETLVEQWTSDGTDHVITAKLAVGQEYILREIEAPFGYEKAADIRFTVSEDEEIQNITMLDVASDDDEYRGSTTESSTTYTETTSSEDEEDSYYRDGGSKTSSKVIENETTATEVTSTGDNSKTALLAAIAAAGIGIILLVVRRRKYKK